MDLKNDGGNKIEFLDSFIMEFLKTYPSFFLSHKKIIFNHIINIEKINKIK
jgi:hypothetical protein